MVSGGGVGVVGGGIGIIKRAHEGQLAHLALAGGKEGVPEGLAQRDAKLRHVLQHALHQVQEVHVRRVFVHQVVLQNQAVSKDS